MTVEASMSVHRHKIWVDDMRIPPDDSYDIARTYDEAVDLLSKNQYTDIYLDHDLGDVGNPNRREMTGYDVLLFLVDRKNAGKYVPMNFHILTANPVGRDKFVGVINRYLSS